MKKIDVLRDERFIIVCKLADSATVTNYKREFERSFIPLKLVLNEENVSSRDGLRLGLQISIKDSGFLIQLND